MCSFFFLLRVRGFVQERQSIIKYWLDNLRAKHGEVLHNIHFLEGQPISMLGFFYQHFILRHSLNTPQIHLLLNAIFHILSEVQIDAKFIMNICCSNTRTLTENYQDIHC